MSENSTSNLEYAGMGVGASVFLWVCFAFFPSLMVSLSITDTLFTWDKEVVIDESKSFISGERLAPFDSHIHDLADKIIICDDSIFARACFWFCIIFIVLGFIQAGLVANIRQTWGIVVPWFLLSIYPFIRWLMWMGGDSEIHFPGVDWMPG